jgi:hypothetical protein
MPLLQRRLPSLWAALASWAGAPLTSRMADRRARACSATRAAASDGSTRSPDRANAVNSAEPVGATICDGSGREPGTISACGLRRASMICGARPAAASMYAAASGSVAR